MAKDFVRDMTQGGAAFSFADVGGRYGGQIGGLAGMGGDLLMRMMFPGQTLMYNTGTAFDRMRAANNQIMMARLQEQFGRAHTEQLRSLLYSQGLGPTTSNFAAQAASFIGLRPRTAIGNRGIMALMDLASDPSNQHMLTGAATSSVGRAFESYFNFDYRARGLQRAGVDEGRRSASIALERARYLRRTGGLGRDDVARGLVAMRNFGLFDPRMTNLRQEDGRWVDRGYLGRARRTLRETFGDLERGTLETLGISDQAEFRNQVDAVRRQNPNMTETEAREEALTRMGKGGGQTYAGAQLDYMRSRGAGLVERFGERAVSGGARTLARAMQFEEANAGGLMQGLKAMRDVGFTGELNQLLEGLSNQFGNTQALNPNFIRSVAADIRAVREATGMAFEEVSNYMQIVSQTPGARAMSGAEVTGMAAEAAALFAQGNTGPMSDRARMAFMDDYWQTQAAIRGSRLAGVQRFLAFGGGTDADRQMLQQIMAEEDVGARTAQINAALAGRTVDGRRLSADAIRVASRLRMGGQAQARMETALQEMEAGFNQRFTDVNREWRALGARTRTDEEEQRYQELGRQRTEMLARKDMVRGAADSAYYEAMRYVRSGTRDRLSSLFGGDVKAGTIASRMLLTNPQMSIRDLRSGLEARGVTLPPDISDEQLRTLRVQMMGLSDVEQRNLITAGGAAAFGMGSETARALVETSQAAFASNVMAADALRDLDDPDRQRLFGQIRAEVGPLPSLLDQFGLQMTPNGEIVNVSGEYRSRIRELTGNIKNEEDRKRIVGAQARLMGLGTSYAMAYVEERQAFSAFQESLIDLNKRRLEAGEEGDLEFDQETVDRIREKVKGGTSTLTETEYLQLYNRYLGFQSQRERARKRLVEGGAGILGLSEAQAEAQLPSWAQKLSPTVTKFLKEKDLEEKADKSRVGAMRQMELSGSVRLVVEDDTLRLVFDKNVLGEAKKQGKGG